MEYTLSKFDYFYYLMLFGYVLYLLKISIY